MGGERDREYHEDDLVPTVIVTEDGIAIVPDVKSDLVFGFCSCSKLLLDNRPCDECGDALVCLLVPAPSITRDNDPFSENTMKSIIVTMPDPDTEPLTLGLMGLSEGGFAFEALDGLAMSADEFLALGTALKRWETQYREMGEVTARDHYQACQRASEVVIEVSEA